MRYTLFLFLILSGCSCKKEVDNYYSGTVKLKMNNQDWEGRIRVTNYTFSNLYMDLFVARFENSIHKEQLGIIRVPKAIGSYRINKFISSFDSSLAAASFITTTSDGDVICDVYEINTPDSLSNTIHVQSYDAIKQELSIKFNMRFIIELPKCYPNAFDTLTISSNTIITKIL